VYRAESSVQSWPIGSELPLADGLRLHAEAPLSGRFKLIRNGKVIAHKSGTEIAISVKESGVYRIEVWLNLAGEDRPWILTNPIYVREKS